MKSKIKWNLSWKYIRCSELDDDVLDKIIKNNKEYLHWEDESDVTKAELKSEFSLIQWESGDYSLTTMDADYYIDDIIFEE